MNEIGGDFQFLWKIVLMNNRRIDSIYSISEQFGFTLITVYNVLIILQI